MDPRLADTLTFNDLVRAFDAYEGLVPPRQRPVPCEGSDMPSCDEAGLSAPTSHRWLVKNAAGTVVGDWMSPESAAAQADRTYGASVEPWSA